MRCEVDVGCWCIKDDIVSMQPCSLTEAHPGITDKSNKPAHLIIRFLTGLLQYYQFVLRNRLPVLAVIPVRHVGPGKAIADFNAMFPHHKIDDGPYRPEYALHTAKRQTFAEQMITERCCIR